MKAKGAKAAVKQNLERRKNTRSIKRAEKTQSCVNSAKKIKNSGKHAQTYAKG